MRQRRMSERALLAAGAIILVGVTAVAILRIATVSASTGAGPVTSLNAAVSSELASRGITATDVSDPLAISSENAVMEASNTFGFTESAVPTESLVQFTDSQQGPVQADGSVSPTYVKTEAWAVVYRGIQMPTLGGPIGMKVPPTHTADFVVFVDARSGKYLTAIAMGT